MQADADRVGQVIRNRVGNALRYTSAAGLILIEVTTEVERVKVIDSDEDIPPEDLPHVFDRFCRGDRSRARSSGGNGLAITKSPIETMGSAIGVESQSGAGSMFWFMVSIARDV